MGVFLQGSVYRRKAAANLSVAIEGTTPYKLSLKVHWVNKWLASSDITVRTRKKATGAKIGKKGGCGPVGSS